MQSIILDASLPLLVGTFMLFTPVDSPHEALEFIVEVIVIIAIVMLFLVFVGYMEHIAHSSVGKASAAEKPAAMPKSLTRQRSMQRYGV